MNGIIYTVQSTVLQEGYMVPAGISLLKGVIGTTAETYLVKVNN